MVVRMHKGQLDYFRRKARKTPTEIYAILAGKRIHAHELEVHYIMYPKLDVSTKGAAEAELYSSEAIYEEIKQLDLQVVGTIHTHLNYPPILSPTDHKGHKDEGDVVSGVVEVTNGKTRVAFWRHDTSLRCDLKYFSKS